LGDLGGFRQIWEGRGELRKRFIVGIDRTHRAGSGTSLGIVLHTKEANPFVIFINFYGFSVFFCSFFEFRRVRGGFFLKFFFGIDRAHQVLLGTSETGIGTHK